MIINKDPSLLYLHYWLTWHQGRINYYYFVFQKWVRVSHGRLLNLFNNCCLYCGVSVSFITDLKTLFTIISANVKLNGSCIGTPKLCLLMILLCLKEKLNIVSSCISMWTNCILNNFYFFVMQDLSECFWIMICFYELYIQEWTLCGKRKNRNFGGVAGQYKYEEILNMFKVFWKLNTIFL